MFDMTGQNVLITGSSKGIGKAIAEGMAAQGANFLIAAGVLPELYGQVWDTSAFIPGHGFVGETLSVLIGYTPRPTGMELVFYCSVLFSVGLTYKLIGSAKPKPVLQPVAADVPAE